MAIAGGKLPQSLISSFDLVGPNLEPLVSPHQHNSYNIISIIVDLKLLLGCSTRTLVHSQTPYTCERFSAPTLVHKAQCGDILCCCLSNSLSWPACA
eukprot:SAG11_NODE_19187_length_472_cov_1.093834_2_plen_96_part_01